MRRDDDQMGTQPEVYQRLAGPISALSRLIEGLHLF